MAMNHQNGKPLFLIAALMTTTLLSSLQPAVGQISAPATSRNLQWSMHQSCTGSENVTSQVPVRSLIQCAMVCTGNLACNRYCFGRQSKKCYVSIAGASPVTSIVALEGSAALSSVVCSRRCPAHLGYLFVRGQCVKLSTTAATYDQATALCTQDAAHVYHFKSHDEDALVFSKVMTDFGLTDDRFTVGAKREIGTNQYFWSDGCPLYTNSSLWYAGWSNPEPTRWEGEYFVELLVPEGWYFNDVWEQNKRYLCQMDLRGSCAAC